MPAEIATRLRNGESNIADHFDDATVIFADIVGFGKITARMKAYEIVACLNQLFSEFDKLAEDVGVEKIKTIGDNYMAVSGVPTPRSNHARMAAKFALDTIAATGRLRSRLPVSFTIRVGLRPRDGRGDRHAQVRLRRLGRYRQHRCAHGGGESAESRARVRGHGEGIGKRLQLRWPAQDRQ